MPRRPSTGIARSASRVTFSPETASRWLSPERRKSSFVASSIPSSSPRTNPFASSASREGIPWASPSPARCRISPLFASPSAPTSAMPSRIGRDGRGERIRLRLQTPPQRLHRRRADPRHLVELVDRGETAVFIAEIDDVAGGDRPDPVDFFQLLHRGGAKADRTFFGGGRGRRRCARGKAFRYHHLLPVGKPRGEIHHFQLGLAGRTPGTRDGIVDAAARRHPVDAGASHRTGDVDDEVAGFAADREALGGGGP